MTVHHLMTEESTLHICPQCFKTVPANWDSEFDHSATDIMYKVFNCECGYKISMRANFDGSGDDTWNDNLDKKLQEAETKSQEK